MPKVPPSLHYTENRGWFTYAKGQPVYFGRDAREAQRKFEAFTSTIPLPDQPVFVAEAVAHWLRDNPGDWHADMANLYDGWAGELSLAAIPEDHLAALVKAFKESHSPQTIKHVLSHATRILRHAISKGWLAKMPRPLTRREHPKVAKHPKDVPAGRLADVFTDLDRSARTRRTAAICRFIASVGCRPEEACLLEWSSIDLDAGTCVLGQHKTADATGQTKTIYLTPQAKAVLESQPGRAGRVFLNLYGRPFTPGGIRSVLRTRGLTGAYQLRHTFAQSALDQLPMEDVAKLLGHADLRMVQTYAQVRNQRARSAAQSLVLPVPEQSAAAPASQAGGRKGGGRASSRQSQRKPEDATDVKRQTRKDA